MCLPCQYTLRPLPTFSDHWLPVFIPILFKLSSISSLRLLRVLSVFLILSIAAAAVILASFGCDTVSVTLLSHLQVLYKFHNIPPM